MKQSGMVVATQWMDKRQINVISTASDPSVTTVSRRTKNGPVNVDIPQAIHDYNSGMFGVDLSDQYRSYYSVGRSGNKWWRYIMWYLVQVSIINAYHLMKSTRPDAPRETPASSHLLFRTAVCKALLMRGASKKKTSEAPAIAGRAKPYSAHHALAKMPGRKRRCFQCSVDGTKMASGRTRETVTGCHLCNVHLHGGACYSKFHEQLKP